MSRQLSAKLLDVMERLLSLVKLVEYHPFLLFQAGLNGAEKR